MARLHCSPGGKRALESQGEIMRYCQNCTGVLRLAIASLVPMLMAATAGAAVLYDANVPRKFSPGDTDPLYYQPGPDSGPGRVLIDDVPINYGTTINPTVNVTKVSF